MRTKSRKPKAEQAPLAITATRIVKVSVEEGVTVPVLAKLAQSDPAFAVRVLAIVNSSAYGLARQVSDVPQAAGLLGIRGLRNIGLGLALSDMAPVSPESRLLLANCLRRAVAARLVAEQLAKRNLDEFFTVGLFLEVGLLSLARTDLARVAEVAGRPAAQRTVFERAAGLTPHPEKGAEVARSFHLPEQTAKAISHHHHDQPVDDELCRVAWAAERVAAVFEGGNTQQNHKTAVAALGAIGIGRAPAETLLAQVPERTTEAAKAFESDIGKQPDLDELTNDAERSLVELNSQYAVVVRQLEQLISEKEALAEELRVANERLARLAATDGLTGLPNKRAFMEAFERDLARAKRQGTPLSLVVVDVDHFKKFNDSYGHQTGDEVLKVVGGLMRQLVRAGDVPGRYGGEEFVLLLPATDTSGALTVAERFRRTLEATAVPSEHGPLRVTASLGVATSIAGSVNPTELFAQADAALYEAKRAGRNRVMAAAQPTHSAASARAGSCEVAC